MEDLRNKFGEDRSMGSEICSQTDRQTDRHTLIAILCSPTGQSNNSFPFITVILTQMITITVLSMSQITSAK